MSNYMADATHPEAGVKQQAYYMDDYYGRHVYGVGFSDGKIFRGSERLDKEEEMKNED